jgi:hypothetical protein
MAAVCCVLLLVAFVGPRLTLFVLWLLTDYLSRAFDSFVLPFLGFLFLPWTTLAYAVAQNSLGGIHDLGLIVVVLGVLADVGALGGGARGRGTAY